MKIRNNFATNKAGDYKYYPTYLNCVVVDYHKEKSWKICETEKDSGEYYVADATNLITPLSDIYSTEEDCRNYNWEEVEE